MPPKNDMLHRLHAYCEIFRYFIERVSASLCRCLCSRYFIANFFYLFYCTAMVFVDFSVAEVGEKRLNRFYIQFELLHTFTAVLYLYVWAGEKQPLLDWLIIPDWMNLTGALFYLTASCLYPYQLTSLGEPTDLFEVVQYLELTGSVLEFMATFGWILQWYIDWQRDLEKHLDHCIGRGFTLDDPDIWGIFSLMFAATYYLSYYIEISESKEAYDTSKVYEIGDSWYFANAICCVLCSMRDCGVFWFMPTHGRFPDLSRDYLTAAQHSASLTGNARKHTSAAMKRLKPSDSIGGVSAQSDLSE